MALLESAPDRRRHAALSAVGSPRGPSVGFAMMSDASLLLAHPGQWLNAFALLIAFAAGWLLLATRLRELRLAPVAQIHPATGRTSLESSAPSAAPTTRPTRWPPPW